MGSRQETDGDDPCTEIWHEPPCAKDPAPGRTAFDRGVSRSIPRISALMKDLGSQPSTNRAIRKHRAYTVALAAVRNEIATGPIEIEAIPSSQR